MDLEQIIKHVEDDNYADFRKDYKAAMKDNYNEKMNIVKKYVLKKVSLNRPTNI